MNININCDAYHQFLVRYAVLLFKIQSMLTKLSEYAIENLLKRKSDARIGCRAAGTTHNIEINFAYSDEAAFCCVKDEKNLPLLWENPKVCLAVISNESSERY